MSMLEDIRDQVAAHFDDPSLETQLKVDCRKYLSNVDAEFLLMDRDTGHTRYIHEYIERQAELASADTHDDHSYSEDEYDLRDRELCTCNDPYCDLKEGRIPVVIRLADSFDVGVERFRQEHPGSPLVLDDAEDERMRREWDAFEHLLTVNIALSDRVSPQDIDSDDVEAEVLA